MWLNLDILFKQFGLLAHKDFIEEEEEEFYCPIEGPQGAKSLQ
jgi:hypothetical protein